MSQGRVSSGRRARAEALAAPLPGLLVRAETLAQTVAQGAHGRRRPGPGAVFWQYRPAEAHEARRIDWRRSAQSDQFYVKETEHQLAQSVLLWVDQSASMGFTSGPPPKAERAAELALALAILLLRGGERAGLLGQVPPGQGARTLAQITDALATSVPLDPMALRPGAQAVLFGDFLGDLAPLRAALGRATGRGVVVQVLDPAERDFPYAGRTLFEDMQGTARHETQSAADLRPRYQARLAARQDQIAGLCAAAGWHMLPVHTDAPAAHALLWLWRYLERA